MLINIFNDFHVLVVLGSVSKGLNLNLDSNI